MSKPIRMHQFDRAGADRDPAQPQTTREGVRAFRAILTACALGIAFWAAMVVLLVLLFRT